MRRLLIFLALLFGAPATLHAQAPLTVEAIPAWVVPVAPPPVRPAESAIDYRLADFQIRFDDKGQHRYIRTIARILAPQGLVAAGNAVVVWKPGVSIARLHKLEIRRDGKAIDVLNGGRSFEVLRREANLGLQIDGVLTAVMQIPDLRVGDEIEFVWSVTIENPVLAGRTEALDAFPAGGNFARFNLRYSWPRGRSMAAKAGSAMPLARTVAANGDVAFTLSRDDFTTPESAAGAPARYLRDTVIQLSDFRTWSDVIAVMHPLYDSASGTGAGPKVAAEVARIAATSSDPLVRAGAALRTVQNEVRYFARSDGLGGYKPDAAERVLESRVGDCKGKTVLLVALLRGLGIDTVPALVWSTGGDGLDQTLPMAAQFDHVIVRATIGGRIYWMDGTGLGDRSVEAALVQDFRWALPLEPGETGLARVEAKVPPLPLDDWRLDLDARAGFDKPAKATALAIFRGESAVTMRALLSFMAKDAKEDYLRKTWSERHDWITIDAVGDAFDEASGELRLTMAGTGTMDWDKVGADGRRYEANKARLGIGLAPERPEKLRNAAPVAIEPRFSATRQTILLPPKGQFAIDGQDISETIGGVTYSRTATLKDGRFDMTATTRSGGGEISFAEAKSADDRTDTLYAMQLFVRAADRLPTVKMPPPADRSRIVTNAVQVAGSISDEDYPPGSILKSEQGTTQVTFDIGTGGTVIACTIASSSGSALLDNQSCALVTERFRFTPAADRRGRAVVERRTQRITWRLPQEDREITPGDLTISYTVAADGSVSDCKASGNTPRAMDLETACKFLRGGVVKDKNGDPIAAHIVAKSSVSVTPIPATEAPKTPTP